MAVYSVIYAWLLRRLGMSITSTSCLRRWQHAEPLVWLIGVGAVGIVLGRTGDTIGLLWCGAGLAIGLLLGHLFWANGRD